MSVIASYNILDAADREALRRAEPERLQYRPEGGAYLNLKGLGLDPLPEIDEPKIARLCRVVRALAFAAVDAGQSGHPGGSSSKAEQVLTLLLSGVVGFDAWHPKHPGRSRLVWSAGHCSPLLHAVVSLVYETLRRKGSSLHGDETRAGLFPEELARFRRWGGPSGHVESSSALADTSTGSSGHGLSAALGFALLHRSCGLGTRAFAIAGDAETEEGMSYEARNLAAQQGLQNLVVTLDLNQFGIDGPITDVLPIPVSESLVRPPLERHRGGRAQHSGTGVRVPAGRRRLRRCPPHGGDLSHHQGLATTAAWKTPPIRMGRP